MKNLTQSSKDYYRMEKALHFLDQNAERQPSLAEAAKQAGLSEYHFQRVFQRWAGISLKKFVRSLTCEAMSPGEYKEKGRWLTIAYGFHPTPFGECFIALTGRGICNLSFIGKNERKKVLAEFSKQWSKAKLSQDQDKTKATVKKIFASAGPIKVLCRGTNFQIKVWEALLKIKPGQLTTYQSIAQAVGNPKAVRAVGTAIGNNPVAYLIPCHRVIRGMGHMGGYRWGLARKRAILALEISS